MQGTNISEMQQDRRSPTHQRASSAASTNGFCSLPRSHRKPIASAGSGCSVLPLIAATGLTPSPARAAALERDNRQNPLSTRTARSDPTHQASWLSAQRCSIKERMERPVGRQLLPTLDFAKDFGDLATAAFQVFLASARARASGEPRTPFGLAASGNI